MLLQAVNKDHVKGILIGVGICAAGYYVYKKNQTQVDEFLKQQGIQVPNKMPKDYNTMSLEELMETKEMIEDVIAEKEVEMQGQEEIIEVQEQEA